MAEINIFTILNQLFYKTSTVKYDRKICSSYILSLWLAHDPRLIYIVNKINPYLFSLKDDLIYDYYFDKIPKGKRFIKWIKKDDKKNKNDKAKEKFFTELKDEHSLSKRELSIYKKMLKG